MSGLGRGWATFVIPEEVHDQGGELGRVPAAGNRRAQIQAPMAEDVEEDAETAIAISSNSQRNRLPRRYSETPMPTRIPMAGTKDDGSKYMRRMAGQLDSNFPSTSSGSTSETPVKGHADPKDIDDDRSTLSRR